MGSPRDAYEILQLHTSALPQVVEAAYRALALVHHPDHTGNADSAAMAELNWAYSVLHDPETRIAYDRSRQASLQPAPVRSDRASLLERMERMMVAATEGDPGSPASAVIDFGRYAGMTLGQIARRDPEYLEWLRRHSSGVRYRHQIDAVLKGLTARRMAVVTERVD